MRLAAWILGGVGIAMAVVPNGAARAQSYILQGETPSAALARHMRTLAESPRDFAALIGAGKAALALGDTQAAAGFFGRADEVWPSSALPQIGKGAALVADGDAQTALSFFARAQQLGASQLQFAADRGLAYDLLGRHSEAQADYRTALLGSDADEARRRLALSLAISGKKDEALAQLAPLMARGDAAGARCRALVLALAGDQAGARRMLDARMPGAGAQMAPFLARLPGLRSEQKAAAVNLGIFPDTGQPYAAPTTSYAASTYTPTPPRASAQSEDRLESIDSWLNTNPSPSAGTPSLPTAMAVLSPTTRQQVTAATTAKPATPASNKPRIWLQLASGTNSDALPSQFKRMKSRNGELFEGISGYVAEGQGRARLLIGPFRSKDDAEIFAEDLASVDIDAFSWTNPPGQSVHKLSTE